MSNDDTKIKLGDTVRLRSGGPVMTASGYGTGAYLTCSWFDRNSELKTGTFTREALDPAKPDD